MSRRTGTRDFDGDLPEEPNADDTVTLGPETLRAAYEREKLDPQTKKEADTFAKWATTITIGLFGALVISGAIWLLVKIWVSTFQMWSSL